MQYNWLKFTPLNTKRVYESIADQIRELIYSGVFKPGDKLPSERELSNQFKVGRMAVREALRILEHSGFIYIKQGSLGGAFIKNADTTVISRSISDMIKLRNIPLNSLTETRLGIEMVVLEFAIQRINNDDLYLLDQNIRETEQQILKGSRATEWNINFHLLLAKASKNPLFEKIIESIMNVTKSFLLSVKPDIHHINRVMNYHKEIYEAIKEKNLPLAKEIMEEHLLDVSRKILELMETSPSLRGGT